MVTTGTSSIIFGLASATVNQGNVSASQYIGSGVAISPLKVFRSGVSIDNMKCFSDLVLIIKSKDGTPACVKPQTAQKLVERGWGTIKIPMISQNKIYPNNTSTVSIANKTITTILIPLDSYNPASKKNFTPANVTVVIGFNNTVQWTNADDRAHNVVDDYSRFNSGLILPNQTWTYVFVKPGTYPYSSVPGPWLRGVVIASPPLQPIPQTLPNGSALIVLREGQQFGPLLVQSITPDTVSGKQTRAYPLCCWVSAVTLHIGDSATNGCHEILTLIKIQDKTATFSWAHSAGSYGCPICLSGDTLIDTPEGSVNVKILTAGMPIWTVDNLGHRQQGTILITGKTLVSSHHDMVHIALDDGRELAASPSHPTADGRFFADLKPGETLDGTKIKTVRFAPYDENYTYDILPSGPTGFYWANGILVASTLK